MKPKYPDDSYCLFAHFPEDTLEHKVLIGMESQSQQSSECSHIRLYSVFEDYVDLYRYLIRFSKDQRFFYEIILGDFPQKPHFDLDIARDENLYIIEQANAILRDVICAIREVCLEHQVALSLNRDVLLYSSHGTSKFSYHIVLHHWCHSNHVQAKGFYEKVLEKCSEATQAYLDSSVYSTKQNFRLLSSQKMGSGRPKTILDPFDLEKEKIHHQLDVEPESPQHEALEKLKESLVSWMSDCKYLPEFADPAQSEKYYQKRSSRLSRHTTNLSDEILIVVQAFLIDKQYPFEVRGLEDQCIALKRLAPSFCEVCQRIHEHENPYIFIQGKTLYLNCRRSKESQVLTIVTDDFLPSEEEEGGESLLDPDVIYLGQDDTSTSSEENDASVSSEEEEKEKEEEKENEIDVLQEIQRWTAEKPKVQPMQGSMISRLYAE
jgi:hypothetical protein